TARTWASGTACSAPTAAWAGATGSTSTAAAAHPRTAPRALPLRLSSTTDAAPEPEPAHEANLRFVGADDLESVAAPGFVPHARADCRGLRRDHASACAA